MWWYTRYSLCKINSNRKVEQKDSKSNENWQAIEDQCVIAACRDIEFEEIPVVDMVKNDDLLLRTKSFESESQISDDTS